jgi:predicted metal-dependent enzyme (double-stranded beta helix superfamily)
MHANLQALIDDLQRITAEERDPAAIVARVKPLARAMAGNLDWLAPTAYVCDAEQGMGITIYHLAPDESLLVETVAWSPGRYVAPHNHKTWGVVVGLDGAERNVGWQRRDDGSTPGHAELVVERETVVRRGDCIALMPEDIHSVHNDGSETSISLHIYGRNLATQNRQQFDPATKTVMPCPIRKRHNA